MENAMIIGVIAAIVVAFFAYQWWSAGQRRARTARPHATGVAPAATAAQAGPAPTAAPLTTAPPKEEKLPDVAGQTEAELRAKEPIQRPVPPTAQVAVMNDGTGPADFGDSLRRPEQVYYQPPAGAPSDVAAGRAAQVSTPLSGHQQAFSPEMAQNGGAMVGNSVFAYDGMEPTEFSSF
jgi:hypothetical protein